MNKIYKSVWSDALNTWVVACELTKGPRTGSCRSSSGTAIRRAWMLGGALVAAIQLAPIASAADYPVANMTDLMQAATLANSDGDANTTITLMQNITTPAGTVFSVATNPAFLGIEASGFTLGLSGPGTAWELGSYTFFGIYGGVGGTDVLTITNGAMIHAPNFMTLEAGGLRVVGSGSRLAVDGDLAVGRGGDASITLANGATLSAGRTFLGEDPVNTLASNITVLVDGPGTVWNSGSYFAAGGAANNVDVTVSNGATIEVLQPVSGSAIGRSGTASLLVTGPGSKFVFSGPSDFYLGQTLLAPGHGTLTIRDGGLASVPFLFMGAGGSNASGALSVDTGGVLETAVLKRDMGSATVNFDNGTLRALADSTPGQPLVSGFAPGSFNLGAGGLLLDSNGFDVTAASVMSGTGGLTKQGAGTLTLSAANTFGGTTAVLRGTLKAGVVNAFSAASAHTVAAGATLDTAGFDQTVARLENTGTVTLLGSAAGSTLTVNGNYVGHNGLLKLGTALGDSSSISDRLVLNGPGVSASGTTTVQITNLGGLGALTTGNGIEVISALNGATTTAQTTKSAFSLAGGHVGAGAFEYRLFAADANGTGENWYLRSTLPGTGLDGGSGGGSGAGTPDPAVPAYRVEVPQFAALPEQLRQVSMAMLGNLHQRVGDEAGAGAQRQAWGRVISIDRTVSQTGTVNPSSEGRLNGFQAGTDLWANPNWHTGVYVGQLDGNMSVTGFARGVDNLAVGSNDLRSQYFGAYATYLDAGGFYVDTVLQGGRHRYDVSPHLAPASHGKGDSLLASVEIGQRLQVAPGWTLEPQLQLMHQQVDLDDVAITGATVQQNSNDGWIARAGLRLKGDVTTAAHALQPYGRLNVYSSSRGTDIARFIGPAAFTDIASSTGGTSTELAAGATLALSNTTSLYGEVGKVWASSGGARASSGIDASLGMKFRW